MTDKILSLAELNRKINTLNNTDDSYMGKIEKLKFQEKENVMDEVRDLYKKDTAKIESKVENILDIIEVTINFVESIASKVPKLLIIVGSAFKGQFKFQLALELLNEFFSDIVNMLPDKLVGNLIDKQVYISFNKDKSNNVSQIEARSVKEVSSKKKKNFSIFH